MINVRRLVSFWNSDSAIHTQIAGEVWRIKALRQNCPPIYESIAARKWETRMSVYMYKLHNEIAARKCDTRIPVYMYKLHNKRLTRSRIIKAQHTVLILKNTKYIFIKLSLSMCTCINKPRYTEQFGMVTHHAHIFLKYWTNKANIRDFKLMWYSTHWRSRQQSSNV